MFRYTVFVLAVHWEFSHENSRNLGKTVLTDSVECGEINHKGLERDQKRKGAHILRLSASFSLVHQTQLFETNYGNQN